MGQELGPDSECVLVDVEVGRVQGMSGPVEPGDAQAEQAAAGVREVAGEVLAAHAGQADLLDVGRADDLAGGLHADGGHLRVVDDRGGTAVEADVDRAPIRRRQSPRDLRDPLLHLGSRTIAQGADRAQELDLLGDHIRAGPAPDAAERHDAGVARIDRPRQDLVEVADQLCGDGDRVNGQVGAGGMTTDAAGHDPQLLARGREHPDTLADPADAQLGIDVQGDDRAHVVHGPGLDHLDRAFADLLRRLEDGPPGDRRRQGVARFPQRQRGRQRHGRVRVVPAGVHHAFATGAIRHALGIR